MKNQRRKQVLILDTPEKFNSGKYKYMQRNEEEELYKNGLKSSYFQNRFGKYYPELEDYFEKNREIKIKMVLKYPFVVNIYF